MNDYKAEYQETLPDKKVKCHLCPHYCVIGEGKSGLCRTRINIEGTFFAQSYGKICSIGLDPIEKKPLYHYYPGSKIFSVATSGCNLRCLNCQNWEISQFSPDENRYNYLKPAEIAGLAKRYGSDGIAFTYTEPTVFYEYMMEICAVSKELGLRNVIISNGYINPEPLKTLSEYIDAANIDLKCFDEKVYKKLAGASLKPVLDTLLMLKEKGIWLEITNLLVPGYSDDLKMIEKMAFWLVENGFAETPIHFSRFFPTHKLADLNPTTTQSVIDAVNIAVESGMKFVYTGNMSGKGGENTVCPVCKHILVRRHGYDVSMKDLTDGACPVCGKLIPGIWD
jgi:pyruvate formate lyase activating enzyme